ncbi:hypothetical protein BJ170DRAFT_6202 [Xylariales sp. AK1849]|nr:hypothetical protein BJ170DRAFT_6202 [Xylariales sp. AK1849]
MLDSSRVFTLLKVLVGLVIFVWSLSYLGFSTNYRRVLRQFKGEKARFVADFLDNEVGDSFDGTSIATLCAQRTWTKGLIFNCAASPGGIGEVRNAHLNCIRFAMEAGAELVVPEIIRRSERDIAVLVPMSKAAGRGVSLDYFYDKQHLNWTLSTFCPQMKLYWSIDELFDVPMGNPISISVPGLGLTQVNGTVIEKPETWRKAFETYLNANSNPKTRTWPLRVNVDHTLYAWPTSYDPRAFVQNFGRILRFREDARQLAASALFTMQKKWLKSQASLSLGDVDKEGYVGVHLRTEKDVWGLDFPVYDEQAAYYLDYIVQSKYRIAYLASGATSENITAFTQRALDFNITVVTKKDLLGPDELQYLERLTWDQQALVDFELMLRANLMAGMCESSFAWSIAMRRAASVKLTLGYTLVPQSTHIRWQDSVSAIMGKEDKNMNMQYSIWA